MIVVLHFQGRSPPAITQGDANAVLPALLPSSQAAVDTKGRSGWPISKQKSKEQRGGKGVNTQGELTAGREPAERASSYPARDNKITGS